MSNKKTPKMASELITDDKNFNKHTEYGTGLLMKSLQKFGGARSIVIDKNNKIIAGNATVEAAVAAGIEKVEVIESDGNKIIAVKRTDIDLNSKRGRELALADNAVSVANTLIDAEIVHAELGDASVEWGIDAEERTDIIDRDVSGERLERFLDSSFMQICLVYAADDFKHVSEALAAIAENEKVDGNAEVVKILINTYKKHNADSRSKKKRSKS